MNCFTNTEGKKAFEFLGPITARSMFGGWSYFCNNAIVGFLYEGVLHLRASDQLAEEFKLLGLAPYRQQRKDSLSRTRFYPIPGDWFEDGKFETYGRVALEASMKNNQRKFIQAQKPKRIKHLPNMTTGIERMLRGIGVSTVEDMKKRGAVDLFVNLFLTRDDVDRRILIMLEGAITGKHKLVVSQARSQELMQKVNSELKTNVFPITEQKRVA